MTFAEYAADKNEIENAPPMLPTPTGQNVSLDSQSKLGYIISFPGFKIKQGVIFL